MKGNRFAGANTAMYALDIALDFAVVFPGADGWSFCGYTFLLGYPAGYPPGSHAEVAEEVRDLHRIPAGLGFAANENLPLPSEFRHAAFSGQSTILTVTSCMLGALG